MRFKECSKSEQGWFIFGAVLVIAGSIMLLNRYTSWWAMLVMWLRQVSRLAVPIALISVGVYVVHESRGQGFSAGVHTGGVLGQQPFTRSTNDARIAGVCGGIAQYFGIESVFVRLIAVLLALASPLLTFITYAILAVVLRKK